jgi:hypothetical protein
VRLAAFRHSRIRACHPPRASVLATSMQRQCARQPRDRSRRLPTPSPLRRQPHSKCVTSTTREEARTQRILARRDPRDPRCPRTSREGGESCSAFDDDFAAEEIQRLHTVGTIMNCVQPIVPIVLLSSTSYSRV